ncbi:Phosphoribosyl-ATP pyrophosphohydrolase-like [uncultured Caudovirales phage]|uniref:Phosphoribosyl-ATP pyrophosphohydrolase-like n=1 Tax=uncultured Caudovirales phage TaxID=2100421 RepID=A0A6J7WRP1_9CAUD|nr:Phosphoribosyl-ATP pyrophosphohydrolase-like [uncultured Caudovirales phage]CAB5220661.1 Phosphoribosyl-ATP pyrophosphohydrolase-like [uncultured Caudovirales phage]
MAKWSYGVVITPLDMVREFATVMGQPLDLPAESWTDPDNEVELLRYELIEEELNEFFVERDSSVNPTDALKELADLVYVCYGYAATFGWDLDEAVKRVHASNMSKLGDDGKPIYREDGKVQKGPNYKKPDLTDLV